MAGLRDLVAVLPPVLQTNLTISNPALSLAEVRIYGSNDANYGTVQNWTPRRDGQPFAVLYVTDFADDETKEPGRVWSKARIDIFIAIEHADFPAVAENYNSLAFAFGEQARQVVASNRRLVPYSLTLSTAPGDVYWQLKTGKIEPKFEIKKVPYYGIRCETYLNAVIPVNYQA